MGKTTIKDVAKEAGVSLGTVSNALNNEAVLAPETKAKVMRAIEKLNYIPNLSGKYLKASETKIIGFLTTSIRGPYFGTLMDAMYHECEKLGYELNIFVTNQKQKMLSCIFGKSLDGIIIFEDASIGERELEILRQEKMKAVFLDREVKDKLISSVLFDSRKSGYVITKYLLELGHRKIVYVSGADTVYDSNERYAGYQQALKEYGIETDRSLVINGDFSENVSLDVTKKFLEENGGQIPDAFLAGNDLSAIGCIRALQEQKIDVPGQVSVVGFDDIDIAPYFAPSLTTIKNPIEEQGIMAVDLLVGMIKGERQGEMIKLPCELVSRNSSRKRV